MTFWRNPRPWRSSLPWRGINDGVDTVVEIADGFELVASVGLVIVTAKKIPLASNTGGRWRTSSNHPLPVLDVIIEVTGFELQAIIGQVSVIAGVLLELEGFEVIASLGRVHVFAGASISISSIAARSRIGPVMLVTGVLVDVPWREQKITKEESGVVRVLGIKNPTREEIALLLLTI